METNNWYMRGNRECAEQIKKEFIRRGAHDPNFKAESFDKTDCLYYLLLGIVHVESDRSVLGQRIVERWVEVRVSEPKPKHTFKPYDKVLMCNAEGKTWFATEFSCYNPNDTEHYYRAINNLTYSHCIPYEGNEHLNGVKFKIEHIEGY